jgi:hypothetical protein
MLREDEMPARHHYILRVGAILYMALSMRASQNRRTSRRKKPGRMVGAIEFWDCVVKLAIAASFGEMFAD